MRSTSSPGTGMTIVEVLVAITVLSIGLLAAAATAAAVTRMLGRAHRAAAAATGAADRLERLRFGACHDAADGTDHNPHFQLTWSHTQTGRHSQIVLVVARYQSTPGRWRADTFATEVLCNRAG